MVPVAIEREVALRMLMDRLRWPVKMVRWRAAKGIRSLLANEVTRVATSAALMDWISTRELESEVVSALTILIVTPDGFRPTFDTVRHAVKRPSLASDFLINEMFGRRTDLWQGAHSGSAPKTFEVESYFEEHKCAQVPPVLLYELQYLEERLGLPFVREWGFEWTSLRKRLSAGYTLYPHYFGDFGLQREGIFGQFIQRQGELFRSAYQRTLACAVNQWGVPLGSVAPFSAYGLPALPDLFEVEPTRRPTWLPPIDADLVDQNGDLQKLLRDILSREPEDEFETVLMRIPLDRSLDEFGELELAAYFITDDFELAPDEPLDYAAQILNLDHYRFNMVRPALEQRELSGRTGTALAVCCNEYPIIHGYWHDDYLQRGLAMPAPYCFDRFTFQRSRREGLSISIGEEQVGSSSYWHDAWTPMYPPNSATRCGCVTRIKRDRLASAATRLHRKIGWFVRLSRMQRPKDGYEREPKDLTAFVRV